MPTHSASRSDIERARGLRNRMTDAELRLWLRLRCEQLDRFRFRRQIPIGPYVVDFVCFKAQLMVEVDGGQHATNEAQDTRRTEWLASQGFRVLRFWNTDVLGETDAVVGQIANAIRNPLPDPPHEGEGTCPLHPLNDGEGTCCPKDGNRYPDPGVKCCCSDRLAGAPGLDGVVVCKMASRVAEHVKAARL
jgi:very-short-patch-repair endonuclease